MYFIDVQGTLISDADRTPLPGAVETMDYLNQEHIPYVVVTNNTKHASREFRDYLKDQGLHIEEGRYLDPLMLLQKHLTAQSVAAYGDAQFLETLTSMGYVLDFEHPESVVVGVTRDYTAETFAQMIEFLLRGAKLLGMHETTLYAKEGKRYPGTGALLKMLEAATFAPYTIVGKPSHAFYEEAKNRLDQGCRYSDITMISDDLKGDLVGAKALGMKTIFVLSGKYRSAGEIIPFIEEAMHPDFIMKDMAEVLAHIKGER